MSTGRRLPLPEAIQVAQDVSRVLAPTVELLKCAGSVRRRSGTVGDIEFLARPYLDSDLLGAQTPVIEPVRRALESLGTWVKGGERMMQITDLAGRPGLRLDLYLQHPPAAWGSLLAIRTGPAELGRYCVTKMREFGYQHRDGRVVLLSNGATVPTETEEQFFACADVLCVPPHRRDELAERLCTPTPARRA